MELSDLYKKQYLAKLTKIGNSKGLRIPKELIQAYGLGENIVIEPTESGMLIHKVEDDKLSWSETFQAMAKAEEDWSEWDATAFDGLEDVPWE